MENETTAETHGSMWLWSGMIPMEPFARQSKYVKRFGVLLGCGLVALNCCKSTRAGDHAKGKDTAADSAGVPKPTVTGEQAHQLELLKAAEPKARLAALAALGKNEFPGLLEALASLLSDQNHDLVCAAADVLGRLGNAAGTRPLLALLKHESPAVRAHSAAAVGRLGGPGVAEALLDLMKEEPPMKDAQISSWIEAEGGLVFLVDDSSKGTIYPGGTAAVALATIGRTSLPAMEQAATSESVVVRRNATIGLSVLQDAESVDPLIALLSDKDNTVRALAIGGLRDLKEPRVVQAMEKAAANDRSTFVKGQAARALKMTE